MNLIFVLDVNEVEGYSRDLDSPIVAQFLEAIPQLWQQLVLKSHRLMRSPKHLGLGAVTMSGMTDRQYVWTAQNISSLDNLAENHKWRDWLQRNLAQFKHV